MALNIIPPGEAIPVNTLIALLLGNPGTGKTTVANTTHDALLLDFDNGSHRSLNRPHAVRITEWAQVADMNEADLRRFKTVTVDTVGRCIDVMAKDIMRIDGKAGANGQLNQKGYGILKGRFKTWLDTVRGYGLNVVLIGHAIEDRQGEDVKLRIDAQGSSKEEVYKVADLMGRITIRDGKRWLDWDPSESGFGKNPAGIPAGPIPDIDKDPGFLQKCIAETLDFMQREQEQQNIEEKRIRELRAKLDADLKDAAAFTELARSMRDTGARNADKQVLVGLAESRGYTLDKKTLSFSDPKATEKAAEEEPAKEAEGAESPAAEGEEKAAEAGAEKEPEQGDIF